MICLYYPITSSKNIINLFLEYNWPGNVRELGNVIESAMNMAESWDRVLNKSTFISSIHIMKDNPLKNSYSFQTNDKSLPEILEDIEKEIISKAFINNKQNITKTAEELGIKRQTLQHKIKKYNL